MTAPRIVVPGATYAVTRRCVCRKAFLGWWHPEVDDIFFWCLAMVAEKCGVHLHHAVRVGSHYHLTFTITRKNLGEFLRLLHHQMSCMLNTLLARERYDAPHELFDARGSHVMRLMDAEAQLGHIVYERLNPPAAGLADTCDGVPGRTLDTGLWKGAGVRLTRPTVYTASKERSRVLRVSPPPLLYRAFGGDLDGLVHHIGKLERAGERAIRAARKRPAKTAAEVRGIHPWDEPMTLRESGGGRVPSFKTGKRGLEGKDAEIRGALEVRAFREAHASANEEWRAGNRDVEYPCGTYEMERFHGAQVADAAWDAWVSAPGPTLDEVKAELGREDVARGGVDEGGARACARRCRRGCRGDGGGGRGRGVEGRRRQIGSRWAQRTVRARDLPSLCQASSARAERSAAADHPSPRQPSASRQRPTGALTSVRSRDPLAQSAGGGLCVVVGGRRRDSGMDDWFRSRRNRLESGSGARGR